MGGQARPRVRATPTKASPHREPPDNIIAFRAYKVFLGITLASRAIEGASG